MAAILASKTGMEFGSLRPITSNETGRYERGGFADPANVTIPSGTFFSSRKPEPEYLPAQWCNAIHPEGQLYFFRQGTLRVVTEAHLYDQDNMARVLGWVERIERLAAQRAFPISDANELFIKLEGDDCEYYLVDHATRALAWLEDVQTEDLGLPPVVSTSQLGILLEELYWSHVEHFPMHLGGLPEQVIDSLTCVLTHAICDQMTSRVSTFPYSKQDCEAFLRLLQSCKSHSLDGSIVCMIARIWSLVCRNRYLTQYGQEHSRLSRDQAVLFDPETPNQWLSIITARCSFGVSDRYLAKLDAVFVDHVVYTEQWSETVADFLKGWRASALAAFFALMLHLFFIPGSLSPLIVVSAVLFGASLLTSALLIHRFDQLEGISATEAMNYLESILSPTFHFQLVALMLALPQTLLGWGTLFFLARLLLVLLEVTGVWGAGSVLCGSCLGYLLFQKTTSQRFNQQLSQLRARPDVIKKLPDRLRGLAGKKLVFDGTLITHRLYFSPNPHERRHIIGWFRLVKELREAGVDAVCVFDGEGRSTAKAKEAARRRKVQNLTVARGSIELDRVQRLKRLGDTMAQLKRVDHPERRRVGDLLENLAGALPNVVPSGRGEVSGPPLHGTLAPPAEKRGTLPAPTVQSNQDSLPVQTSMPSPTPTPTPATPPTTSKSALDQSFPLPPVPSPPHSLSTVSDIKPAPVETALDSVAEMYIEFLASVQKLASLTPTISSAAVSATDEDVRVEYSMSKTQVALAQQEANLWRGLSAADFDAVGAEDSPLSHLSAKAETMSKSYQRRTDVPTTQTYNECKSLLRAMGVACVSTTGSYEAEALAASMVIHKMADFVVSEDTDVVIYEAPLLRNITNRKSPLLLLNGTEVRTALSLSRASFIDFALLLGTDFSQRIKNVGPARALKLIHAHETIERLVAVEGAKYPPRTPPEEYLQDVRRARKVFGTLPPVPAAHLIHQEQDDGGLAVLLQRFGLGRLLMADDIDGEGEYWDYEQALTGNYFGDNPTAE
ncbi:unnamed protein product [Mycena citricolor]|uniref:XPG-I domain-containing protein n=1 Tax=Mycena citricolor TaxID=2018698 RepID=A0AAD2HIF1_9AGAR|nr:unnamed protein product [Mycena citricolor]